MPTIKNLLHTLPNETSQEVFEPLLHGKALRLERIISTGQATPAGEWYDQAWDEWVILLSGAAHVRFADEPHLHHLQPGDAVFIPAHCRHRVEWTASDAASVWLALHLESGTATHCLKDSDENLG